MDSIETFSHLLTLLEYETSPNLVKKETPRENIPPEAQALWDETQKKLPIDAIYFVANTPIIYFKRYESFDSTEIAELHKKVWNQCLVPLIFVILPDDIRVYSGYEAPRQTSAITLVEPYRVDNQISSSHNVWERISVFTRLALESGSFWRDYSHLFRKEMRVDRTLMANLRYIRRKMIEETGLSPEYTHSLIGRSIFAFYLQDRGVLPAGEEGFFAQTFKKNYTRYTDILTSYEDTYAFFDILREHFNGDIFPVTLEEKAIVSSKHLGLLKRLFTVDTQAGGQLLFFWAYNFAFIPLELISAIYEEFLYQEESGQNGAYYTPPLLVDFMLDQVLPWSDAEYKLRLLDPACGSGIFLVEAYRRLVERWRKVHGPNLSFKDLSEIATSSIFGIDIKRQALRVAAFSLYLAMLDYLEPKTIWREVVFPPLIGTNLIEADFFDEATKFKDGLFDIIIGNPPWESQLSFHAKLFLIQYELKVGDKQIVQAFLWGAPKVCKPHGLIALLCSSKSLLFNQSGPNILFRQKFFNTFNIKAIFDFSALRRSLFEKGIAPAAAIIYTPTAPTINTAIFYGAPKPTYLTRLLASMLIDSNEIKQIPLRQVLSNIDVMRKSKDKDRLKQQILFSDEEVSEDNSVNIWKVALWGTSRDYTLLEALNSFPPLGEVIHRLGWDAGSGFIRRGPGKSEPCSWLDNALFLEAKDLTRYGIDSTKLRRLPANVLYHRGRSPKRFRGPLVLFKRGQAQRRPSAAYLDKDCAYTNAITGISGSDPNLLKVVTALLNSELAQYYLFFASSSWGVEREEIRAGEMRNLPFPFFDVDRVKVDTIAQLVDELAEISVSISKKENALSLWDSSVTRGATLEALEEELNKQIYSCFQLSQTEIQLIHETVHYTLGFFYSPENSSAQLRPTAEMRLSYAQSYVNVINFYLEPIGRKLKAVIYLDENGHLPYLVTQFFSESLHENADYVEISPPDEQMKSSLVQLQKISIERTSRQIYHRRNFRIYDHNGNSDSIFIIKPAEQRLWTTSAALCDAEETIAELLRKTFGKIPKKIHIPLNQYQIKRGTWKF